MIVDLFAGPGGWSEGIRRHLGLRDIGLEWDTAACRTRAAARHTTIQCDVAQYPTAPFAGRITGLIASPPCQAWSRAGKRGGLADQPLVHQAVHDLAHGRDTRAELLAQCRDERSLLAAEPMRWLHDLRPEWVCMEEVPDVLPLWRQYAEHLRSWGYSAWAGTLNTADYGVPQTRQRAILIASRVRRIAPPAPTHTEHDCGDDLFGESLPRWVTMAEALGWGATERVAPTVTAGGGKTGGAEPFPSQARQALIREQERGAWVLRNGTQKNACVRDLNEPAGTLFFGQRCNDVSWVLRNGNQPNAAVRSVEEPAPTMAFGNNSARVEWVQQRPAPTIVTTRRSSDGLVVGRQLPPGESKAVGGHGWDGGTTSSKGGSAVRITTQEAAVLQSFPDDYPWQGTKTKQFEQIGNAVPPLLAAHIVSAATGIPMTQTAPAEAA